MASGDATLMYNFPQWHPLSQQSSIPNCHRVQVNRKKNRKKRKKGCFCYSSKLGTSSTCNTVIALSLFLILIVVITIAAMAIYIGMEIILDGSLRVTQGDYYTVELYNRTSQLFYSKAHTYKIMIEKVFARSILGPSIKQCIIMGFRNGSLVVFYRLILDRRKIPSRTFANLEETAKKILFEEITALKPAIFSNMRLDPKQIIVKKHVLNTDSQVENTSESILEEVTLNPKNYGVLRRVTYTTPAIVRRKTVTPSIISITPSVTSTRLKNMKKHRQPTVEKSSKIKLQLDSSKSSTMLSVFSSTVKSIELKKNQNLDINISANRYSFVSNDGERTNDFNVSGNNVTQGQGFGEAEVIIIPSTAEEEHLQKSENAINQKQIIITAHSNQENKTQTQLRNTISSIQHTQIRENDDKNSSHLAIKNVEYPLSTNIGKWNSSDAQAIVEIETNANDTEKLYKKFPLNVPTRSNVALNKPLRPKPVMDQEGGKIMRNITFEMEKKDTKEEDLQTTEEAVIILNTEVVTSTSVQVSYGEEIISEDEELSKENSTNTKVDDYPVITHNVQSLSQLAGAQMQLKYKNIFPRSIRDDKYEKMFDEQSMKTGHSVQQFSSVIEKYKKQPSNETLHLIIEHIASMYTKATTEPANITKLNTVKYFYNDTLMTRPMHKILISTTMESLKNVIDCEVNATKQCANGQCILEHLWCNQFADCNDGSDEKNCTCSDYLRAQFSHKKICDGIVDCWDFSDENSCEWCSSDKYVCINAKLCIEQNRVCDGHRDCPAGDDEKNCITISHFQQKNNDITYHSEGIITVQRSGIWGKLCYENEKNESKEYTLEKLSELGKAVCKTMTFKNFVAISVVNDLDEERISNLSSHYYKLTHVTKNYTSSLRRKNFKFVKTLCSHRKVVQVTCKNLECGMQTQIGKSRVGGKYRGERQSRIVGGGSAVLGAWPWQAALYKEGEFQCGATLISNKWLLSAGHCFNNGLYDYWVARLGILRRSSTLPSPHEQIRPIRRIIVHPQYAEAGFLNDISILEMNTKIHFTNFVRPICLPNLQRILLDGTLCTVIGWGQLMENGGLYPDTLQEVQLPVISPSECHKRTMFLPLYKITDGMLCAGFERGGRDACLGDSGGPLMCQDNGDAWHLYGITSNGNGCARAHRPGVYTKVVNYLNWINNHTKNGGKLNSLKITPAHCNGYRCPLGECLPKARICNGYMECSDGSDERGC